MIASLDLGDPSAVEPVLALCGPSGAGKTTALVELIPELKRRGLRVAVVKHSHHQAAIDPSGKDSARLFAAGADVVLTCPGESLGRRHRNDDPDPVLRALLADNDLVLVEGHKGSPLPKLWLEGEDRAAPPAGVEGVLESLPRDSSRGRRLLSFVERWLADAWRRRPLFGGLLIGGRASRMGRPKQSLGFAGRTIGEIVSAALAERVERVVTIGSGDCPAAMNDLPRLPDVVDTRGPLAGMLAALRWAPRATWIFAACDLPLADSAAVAWLEAQRRPGCWAILPRVSASGVEPLLALYEPQARPLLEELAASGRAKPSLIADHPSVASPEPPPALARAWTNVNTPEDLARLDPGGSEEA